MMTAAPAAVARTDASSGSMGGTPGAGRFQAMNATVYAHDSGGRMRERNVAALSTRAARCVMAAAVNLLVAAPHEGNNVLASQGLGGVE